MARLTIKNPSVHPAQKPTYRIPIDRAGEFSIKTFGRFTDMHGDMVTKLGKYEDLGEPEELAKKLGIRLES